MHVGVDRRLRRGRVRGRSSRRRARTKWTLHVFDMAAQKDVDARTARSATAQLSPNGEQIDREEGRRLLRRAPSTRRSARRPLGDEARPRPACVYRVEPRSRVDADLQRRLALVPRLLLRRRHARPRLEGDRRQVTGAMLPAAQHRGPSSTGSCRRWSASCASRTPTSAAATTARRRRRRAAGLHRPASAPTSPPDAAAGSTGLPRILGPTAYNRDLDGAARPARRRREGGRLPRSPSTATTLKGRRRPLPATCRSTRGQKVAVTVNRTPSAAERARRTRSSRSAPSTTSATTAGSPTTSPPCEKASNGERRLHAHHRDGLRQHRPVRQVLARLPRPEGAHHRRPRQRRRLDRVLHHRQARAEAGGLQRPARHGAVPLPGLGRDGATSPSTNEYNGSDGEAFVEHFKAAQARHRSSACRRGAAWSASSTASRRSTTARSTSRTTRSTASEGQWLVENHGADPDILVDNDPGSAVAGRDLQLEKAIAVMLEKVKANPLKFAPKPAYPEEANGRSERRH
ncbi:MAG: hypothetical protein MZW92_10005 [Comamonadaceae bacterium]|nr:hypothetical protein [Comamonadaceae bacterium]